MNTSVTPPRRFTRLRSGRIALELETTSSWKDFYFAQWLTVHRKWQRRVRLPVAEMDLVPSRHTWFMAGVVLEPLWASCDRISMSFGVDGYSAAELATLDSTLSCWRTYDYRYLNGETIFVPPVLPSTGADRRTPNHCGPVPRTSDYRTRIFSSVIQKCCGYWQNPEVLTSSFTPHSRKRNVKGPCNTSCVSIPPKFCLMFTEGDGEKARTLR